jgi:myo-inositol-1(or 4)-monophosphatase
VTDIDFAVEDLIRKRIGELFPSHGVLGEEYGEHQKDAEFVWVIDPVDGTHSLRHGVPLFGTLLALRHRDRFVLGLIDLPILNKRYVAAKGLGARCNGQLLQFHDVASQDDIPREIIGIGERKQFVRAGQVEVFDGLMRMHASVRTYCDCFGHALAIEGCLGAMVDYNLGIWDVAATEVIMAELDGAYFRVDHGLADDRRAERHDVVFGKPTVVKWVLEKLILAQ